MKHYLMGYRVILQHLKYHKMWLAIGVIFRSHFIVFPRIRVYSAHRYFTVVTLKVWESALGKSSEKRGIIMKKELIKTLINREIFDWLISNKPDGT